MRLADLNQNSIQLGYTKKTNATQGLEYQPSVPTSLKQRQKAHIDQEDDGSEAVDGVSDPEGDVDDVKDGIERTVDTIQVANSMAPFKGLPDARKPPGIGL